MSQSKLNHYLTSLDSIFLNIERKEAPMHIGGIGFFEGKIPFEAFVKNLNAKLPLLPRYQQIVTPAPLHLGHPSWEFDPHFDIRRHIFKVQLDAPGTDEQMSELCGRIFTPMMDRTKPLWDLHLVYGLKGNRSAIITRVHHCLVDGVSGVDLLNIMLDPSPTPSPPPKQESGHSTTEHGLLRRLFDLALGGMKEEIERFAEFEKSLVNLAQALFYPPSRQAMRDATGPLSEFLSPTPRLLFNRPGSGQRKLVWTTISFDEARAIGSMCQAKVNDVMLAALSDGISRYLQLHGQRTKGRHLRIMVPVNLRHEDQHGSWGNLISLLPVEIPLDMEDPLERLHYVSQETAALKGGRIAEGVNVLFSLLGMLPAPVQALLDPLLDTSLPLFNMVITNVPGPKFPLYSMGRRMTAHIPYVPIGYAMGCGGAILSYDQKLFCGLTSDAQAMPDGEVLRDLLEQSYAQLREATGVKTPRRRTTNAVKKRRAAKLAHAR